MIPIPLRLTVGERIPHLNEKRLKIILGAALLALPLLAPVGLLLYRPPPEGAIPQRDIVSSCAGDATGDGLPELLLISGDGVTEDGERHGQRLLVCHASAGNDLNTLGYIPSEEIQYSIDLTDLKPMKVQLGDINGDGLGEIALCVYKTAKFHPVPAKRPFFFDLKEGNLIPVWLGSRLSRPFDDYILSDPDGDGTDEIVSVELLENGKRVLSVYNWAGFGFELLTQSDEFDGMLRFVPSSGGETAEIRLEFTSSREQNTLRFRLTDNKLICISTNME
jgi:hypothetical protein